MISENLTTILLLLGTIFSVASGTPDPCCTNMVDMCSSLQNVKAKIVSSDDISGSCDISDDCTTLTCDLVVVKNDFPVNFTLKLTLLPCSSPYAVELSLHAVCDDAEVLVIDEMFNESRRVNVVLFVVDAVFAVDISQDCDGLTLSVSLMLPDNVINFIPSSKISMYCEGASCMATSAATQVAPTATYSPSTASSTMPVVHSRTPCCSTEEEMCSSLESIKAHWQDITLTSSALSGSCNVSANCTGLECQLQTGIADFGVSFYLTFALRPCAIPYAVEIKAFSPLFGPIFAGIFSESRNMNISFLTVSAIVVGIKQQCNGLVLSFSAVISNIRVDLIPLVEIPMFCSSRQSCETHAPTPSTSTALSAISVPISKLPMSPMPSVSPNPSLSSTSVETMELKPSSEPCCPTKEDMCSSLKTIASNFPSLEATSDVCQISDDCDKLTCSATVTLSGFNIPLSIVLRLLPCADSKSVQLTVSSLILGSLVDSVFSETRTVGVSVFGINSVDVAVSITQTCNGLDFAVDLLSNVGNIVVIPSTEIFMYCESRIGCEMSTFSSVLTTSLSFLTSPSFMVTPTATPTALPCLPTCSRAYCLSSVSPFCSIPGESPCVLTSCKACYYSATVRSRPSGCERFTCGRNLNEDNQLCWKKLARCIRDRDRRIHGEPAKHLKEEKYFKCYAL